MPYQIGLVMMKEQQRVVMIAIDVGNLIIEKLRMN